MFGLEQSNYQSNYGPSGAKSLEQVVKYKWKCTGASLDQIVCFAASWDFSISRQQQYTLM